MDVCFIQKTAMKTKSVKKTQPFAGLYVLLVLLLSSFVNYCLLQIGVPLYIPCSLLVILAILFSGHKISAISIILIGIVDDLMLNAHFGVFTLTYSVIAYVFSLRQSNKSSSLSALYILCIIYVIANFFISIILKN